MNLKLQLSIFQSRLVDKIAIEQFGMSGLVLMENAGRGVADWIISRYSKESKVLVLCGPGNNGGDGLVLARHLSFNGFETRVCLFNPKNRLSHDCQKNLEILQKTSVLIHEIGSLEIFQTARQSPDFDSLAHSFENADLVVDALLGTGASGDPSEPFASAILLANQTPATRIAIDIPSGLDGNSGFAATPTFQAHYTLTFVASKTGFGFERAFPFLGKVFVLPIGVPQEVLEQAIQYRE